MPDSISVNFTRIGLLHENAGHKLLPLLLMCFSRVEDAFGLVVEVLAWEEVAILVVARWRTTTTQCRHYSPEGFIPFGLCLIFLFFETLK